ncbi:hypothetical protein [Streptomyces sp. NPDC002057]|uniref:hypothetical protein n=1 Tax=Streptomyces sp. NPDC002057 TaxID=3154664 RepID=UPI0033252050
MSYTSIDSTVVLYESGFTTTTVSEAEPRTVLYGFVATTVDTPSAYRVQRVLPSLPVERKPVVPAPLSSPPSARKGTGAGLVPAVRVGAAGAAADAGAAVAGGATSGPATATPRTTPTDIETRRDKPVRKVLSLPNFMDTPL